MDIKAKLLKILSLDVMAKIIFAIVSLSVIRIMPIDDFAIYTIALVTINLVTSVVSSIFNRIYIVADFKTNITVSSFLSFQLFLVVLIFILLFPLNFLYEGFFELVFITTILQVFFMFVQTYYQREMQFRAYYKVEFTRVFVYVCMFIGLNYINETISIENMLIIQAVASGFVFFIFGLRLLKLNEILEISNSLDFVKQIFHSSYKYIFLYSLVVVLLVNTDVYMLRLLDDKYQVAIFGAAFTYYAFLQVALGSVHKLLLPLIQKTTDIEELQKIMNEYKKITLWLLPIFIIGAISSAWIIPIVDNGKYPESIVIFQILTVSSYISFIFSPYSNIVLKFNENKYIFILYLSAFVIHIGVLFIIIPFYHACGIAFVSLITYGFVNYMTYLKSKKIIQDKIGTYKCST